MVTETVSATDELIENIVSCAGKLQRELGAPGARKGALVYIREIRRSLVTLEQQLVDADSGVLGDSC